MLEVLSAGPQASVQDLGWRGWRDQGLNDAGALDQAALRLANALVGNPARAAVIEITWGGAAFRALSPLTMAVTGAQLKLECDGRLLHCNQAFAIAAGQVLRFGTPLRGARCILAVHGGIDVPMQLGARATQLKAGFGGFQGRALRRGDCLPIGVAEGVWAEPGFARSTGLTRKTGFALPTGFSLDTQWLYPAKPLRILVGSHASALSPDSLLALSTQQFTVSLRSDRMGLRMAPALYFEHTLDLSSEPLLPGTLQLPPGGEPILLTRDCQSTGGYPRIAHVARADWDRLAQLRPGDPLHFCWIEPEAARALALRREAAIAQLEQAIHARYARSFATGAGRFAAQPSAAAATRDAGASGIAHDHP